MEEKRRVIKNVVDCSLLLNNGMVVKPNSINKFGGNCFKK